MMKKIGILGGTFDPIHNGHLMMGRAAVREECLDELWYMPTGTPAYKNDMQKVTDKEHRARMTELAVAGESNAVCSYLELERDGNTYTADTLTALKSAHPSVQFYYIVGADSLDYMDRWYQPEEIFSRAIILAVRRNTQSEEEIRQKILRLTGQFHADIRLLDQQHTDVSSTQIRQMAARGEDFSSYVPEAVYSYIQEHRLYRDEIRHPL